MASRVLLDTSLATISIDDVHGVVTLERKPTPLDIAVLERAATDLASLLPLRERPHLALLIDMRKAPLADPAVEAKLGEFALAMQRGFLTTSTVLATAVGRLQASRMRRERGFSATIVVNDADEARKHLEAVVREHRASQARPRLAKG